MNENNNNIGSAHFLEHLTFAGTKNLPTEIVGNRYASDNDIYQNAFTHLDHTTFIADGYDLNSTAFLITQRVFKALLPKDEYEKVKKAVITEISGNLSDPYLNPRVKQWKTVFGQNARYKITGDIEDIENMTYENLLDFYEKNYKLENCSIVVCSSESIDSQRKKINDLLRDVKSHSIKNIPNGINYSFNPDNNKYSLDLVDVPKNSTTSFLLYYPVQIPINLKKRISYDIFSKSFSDFLYSVLRTDLDLVYSAYGGIDVIANLAFDSNEMTYYFYIFTEAIEKNVIKVLNAIMDKVINVDIPDHLIQSAIVNITRDSDYVLQNNPESMAKSMTNYLFNTGSDHLDFFEEKEITKSLSVSDIQKLKKEILSIKPVITASSPSQKVLDDIKEWADKLK
jgi:predicted Zn-dependent peptidase